MDRHGAASPWWQAFDKALQFVFALTLSRQLAVRGIHYAWVVAAVTFFAMLSTSAALGLPGALMQPLRQEFGWSTDALSSVFAVRFALFGLIGPFAAVFMSRFGVRRVMVSASSCIALALLLATQATTLWQLFLLWGVLLGCATGLTALVLGAIVASRWFTARRGLVVGILAASTATGQLMFLPLAAWLVERHGWRAAVLPAFAAALLSVLAVLLLMRDRPEDLDLLPLGESPGHQAPSGPPGIVDFLGPFRMLREAAAYRTFWILSGTFFICGLSTSGLVQTHFISLCGDRGLAAVPAASVLSMMGLFDLLGTTLSGYLSDRYDNRKLLFWYYGLRGLSLFWLPFSSFSIFGLSLFALFYGLDWIATVPPTVRLSSQTFGRERSGLVFGWIFAAHQVGSAIAAYGAGLSRTLLLSYTPALLAAGSACVLAALLVFAIGAPARADTALKAVRA